MAILNPTSTKFLRPCCRTTARWRDAGSPGYRGGCHREPGGRQDGSVRARPPLRHLRHVGIKEIPGMAARGVEDGGGLEGRGVVEAAGIDADQVGEFVGFVVDRHAADRAKALVL